MTTHQDDQGIIAQLERLNLKTDSNTTSITQLAEIVKFQVIQAERDRQTFQSNFTVINQQAERDRQTLLDTVNTVAEVLARIESERYSVSILISLMFR